METKLIALLCVVLVAGAGGGIAVGYSMNQNQGTQEEGVSDSNELKDYSLIFGEVTDHKTTFSINFDAGIGGYLYIFDGKTLMNYFLIDAGKSSRTVSVNTELSTLNHLTFKFDECDLTKELTFDAHYYLVKHSGDYGPSYTQWASITITHNDIGNKTANLVTTEGTATGNLSSTLYVQSYYQNTKPTESEYIFVEYLQVDHFKFHPTNEVRDPY